MGYDIGEELLADTLAAEVPCSCVWSGADEGFTEDVARVEMGMEPFAAGGVRHDSFNVGNAIGFCQLRRLLCSADVFAIREVTHHRSMCERGGRAPGRAAR